MLKQKKNYYYQYEGFDSSSLVINEVSMSKKTKVNLYKKNLFVFKLSYESTRCLLEFNLIFFLILKVETLVYVEYLKCLNIVVTFCLCILNHLSNKKVMLDVYM